MFPWSRGSLAQSQRPDNDQTTHVANATGGVISQQQQSGSQSATTGLYGIDVFHDSNQAVVDIVFVHGLTGNREKTWTSKDGVNWPKDLLPRDLPNTRIMTYGYDADIVHFWAMASQNRIGEHAGNLVNAVTQVRERTDSEKRPIIFVAHSLGGLVAEDALLFSKNSAEPHLQDVVQSAIGICFLGTPHCGSDLARWGSILGSLVNVVQTANVDLVNVLKTDSEVLARVQREFHTMLRSPFNERRSPLSITCFFEELPVRGAGEIVPKHSAILPSYNAIGIRENHMDMTKFTSANDAGYLSVSGELRRWVKAASARQANPSRAGDHVNSYGGPPHPSGPEVNRYGDRQHLDMGSGDWHPNGGSPAYGEKSGGYPYSEPRRQPPGYGDNAQGFSPYPEPYPEDTRRFAPPSPDPRQYPQPPWQNPQHSSPPPPSEYSGYRSYGASHGTYSPRYGQYRSEGYSRPPPPPEPRYIEDAPAMASPPPSQPQQEPKWDRRPAPTQQEPGFYQGSHTIATHNQQTHGSGKTVQGMNLNVTGDVSF